MGIDNITRVGIGVMILKDSKVLLGKRKGSHAGGEYSFPGGHLEYMESFEECARRETKEECGVEIKNVRFQFLANIKDYAPKHYVQVNLLAEWKNGDPEVKEPTKCENWGWYALDRLPSPIFRPSQMGIDSYKSGFIYKDAA